VKTLFRNKEIVKLKKRWSNGLLFKANGSQLSGCGFKLCGLLLDGVSGAANALENN